MTGKDSGVNQIPSSISVEQTYFENNNTFSELIENKELLDAIELLTVRQRMVLKLRYVYNLRNIDIAKSLGTTPQNISNINRKSVNKIRKFVSSKKCDSVGT